MRVLACVGAREEIVERRALDSRARGLVLAFRFRASRTVHTCTCMYMYKCIYMYIYMYHNMRKQLPRLRTGSKAYMKMLNSHPMCRMQFGQYQASSAATCTCTQCTCSCICTCTYVHVTLRTCTCTHLHVHVHVHVYTCVHACKCHNGGITMHVYPVTTIWKSPRDVPGLIPYECYNLIHIVLCTCMYTLYMFLHVHGITCTCTCACV